MDLRAATDRHHLSYMNRIVHNRYMQTSAGRTSLAVGIERLSPDSVPACTGRKPYRGARCKPIVYEK